MFDKVDFVTIIVLIIVIGVYMYVLAKNNLLFKKSNNNQIYSLLDKNQSLLFEIIEICVLFIIPILLYNEKKDAKFRVNLKGCSSIIPNKKTSTKIRASEIIKQVTSLVISKTAAKSISE